MLLLRIDAPQGFACFTITVPVFFGKDLEIVKGKEKIKYYQFNTKAAKHFFCSVCGINTHNLRRSDPNTYGVNVGCLEDISTKELFELNVRVNDGKNHKMDRIEKWLKN